MTTTPVKKLTKEEIQAKKESVYKRPKTNTEKAYALLGAVTPSLFLQRMQKNTRINPFHTAQYKKENASLCTGHDLGMSKITLSLQRLSTTWDDAMKAIGEIGEAAKELVTEDPRALLEEEVQELNPNDGQVRSKTTFRFGLLFSKLAEVVQGKESGSDAFQLKGITSGDTGTLSKIDSQDVETAKEVDEQTIELQPGLKDLSSIVEKTLDTNRVIDIKREQVKETLFRDIVLDKATVSLTKLAKQGVEYSEEASAEALTPVTNATRALSCFAQKITKKPPATSADPDHPLPSGTNEKTSSDTCR